MRIKTSPLWLGISLVAATVGLPGALLHAQEVHTVNAEDLPKMDGNHLRAEVIEVNYPPGGSTPPHSHPCPVIGVVVEGSIRSQVKGQPEAVYQAGQSFYEPPNGVHLVSANADNSKPAKLLAFFVCDHKTPLTVMLPQAKSSTK